MIPVAMGTAAGARQRAAGARAGRAGGCSRGAAGGTGARPPNGTETHTRSDRWKMAIDKTASRDVGVSRDAEAGARTRE